MPSGEMIDARLQLSAYVCRLVFFFPLEHLSKHVVSFTSTHTCITRTQTHMHMLHEESHQRPPQRRRRNTGTEGATSRSRDILLLVEDPLLAAAAGGAYTTHYKLHVNIHFMHKFGFVDQRFLQLESLTQTHVSKWSPLTNGR